MVRFPQDIKQVLAGRYNDATPTHSIVSSVKSHASRFFRLGAVLSVLVLYGCSIGTQSATTALVREPGERVYRPPIASSHVAATLLPYAVVSAAAYDAPLSLRKLNSKGSRNPSRPPDSTRMPASTGDMQEARDCQWVGDTLTNPKGWEAVPNFPSEKTEARFSKLGLQVRLWKSSGSPEVVAVVFRGTDFDSWRDWVSNFRWALWLLRFLPGYEDQYTETAKTLGPEFVGFLDTLASEREPVQKKGLRIIAAGHSLGGGLAQHFAYALPRTAKWKVEEVYAFDPSPVTGWYSTPREDRLRNAKDLLITRVYEHGEILAYLRLLLSYANPPSVNNPSIRQVRFNYVQTINPVASHSMVGLACALTRDAPSLSSVEQTPPNSPRKQ